MIMRNGLLFFDMYHHLERVPKEGGLTSRVTLFFGVFFFSIVLYLFHYYHLFL